MKRDYYIHESSYIGENVTVGEKTKIWQFCNIMDGVSIGKNCNIGQNVFMEQGVKIGNNATIKNNIALYTGVVCEDDVFLGPNCVFTNVINPRSFISRKKEYRPTLVKKGASIGANATVVCGSTIGSYAMVGAGSVITKDVPDYALVYGNPARLKSYVCKCGKKLTKSNEYYVCSECGKKYRICKENKIKLIEV